MKPIDPDELAELEVSFGTFPIRPFSLEISSIGWQHWQRVCNTDRRAEVVLVLPRPSQQVVLIRKDAYPAGIHRLPTGGVGLQEAVLSAAERETLEESGLKLKVERVLGVLDWTLKHSGKTQRFASYCCLFPLSRGPLEATDPHEKISNYQLIPWLQLDRIASQLCAISGDWRSWGLQRAEPHKLVWELLKKG